MEIVRPTISDVETLVDYWVELAADQRQYGSRLLTDANRESVTDAVARHVVTDGLLVACERGETDHQTDERDSNDILGFIMYHVEDGRYRQDRTTGVIVNLYVRPDARGDGIGSRLLEAAEDELAEADVDTVTLEVLAANDAARRFYSRHGYRNHRIELAKSIENDTHSKGEP